MTSIICQLIKANLSCIPAQLAFLKFSVYITCLCFKINNNNINNNDNNNKIIILMPVLKKQIDRFIQ